MKGAALPRSHFDRINCRQISAHNQYTRNMGAYERSAISDKTGTDVSRVYHENAQMSANEETHKDILSETITSLEGITQ